MIHSFVFIKNDLIKKKKKKKKKERKKEKYICMQEKMNIKIIAFMQE